MSEENQEEPSIEEILASIRQIISDDDEQDAAVVEEAEAEPEPEVVATPEPEPEPEPVMEEPEAIIDDVELEEEVFELTDELEVAEDDDGLPEADESLMSDMDIDFDSDETEIADAIEEIIEDIKDTEEKVIAPIAKEELDNIIGGDTANITLGAFERLAQSIPVARSGREDNTLEDIVRDMLRPMLRSWVDDNLPEIAERLVKKELERLVDKATD